MSASNSLGLDLSDPPTAAATPVDAAAQNAQATDPASAAEPAAETAAASQPPPDATGPAAKAEKSKKEKPYINPDRVSTGGTQRV
jgi:hypothetical protein